MENGFCSAIYQPTENLREKWSKFHGETMKLLLFFCFASVDLYMLWHFFHEPQFFPDK